MYTITLADGITLDNLELNGNNYIADCAYGDAVFEGNLAAVTISDGTSENVYQDMVLIQNKVNEGRSWFILAEKTPEQKEREAREQQITDLQLALVEMYEMTLGGGV